MSSSAPRSNNLDALRLLGAAAVILGHAYHLTGRPTLVPGLFAYPVSTIGVVVFFSISGYLITASWSRNPHVVSYTAARALRIFPALIVVVLLTVFVLGPAVTTLPVGEYFDSRTTPSPQAPDLDTLRYLMNIAMQPQYYLPGVFTADVPYPNAVNGSLWTLPAELFCYVMVPLLCLVPRFARPLTFAAALAVSLVLAAVPALDSPVIWGSRISDAAGMWVFFATGALLRLAHERWRGFFRTDVAVVLCLAYLVVISILPVWTPRISWLALPYIVLTMGLASTPYVRRAARFGDLSYGMYLVGFPVQQLVVVYVGIVSMSLNLVLVVAISAVLSLVSWHLVEAPSMRLKNRLVARTMRGTAEVPRAGDPSPSPVPTPAEVAETAGVAPDRG